MPARQKLRPCRRTHRTDKEPLKACSIPRQRINIGRRQIAIPRTRQITPPLVVAQKDEHVGRLPKKLETASQQKNQTKNHRLKTTPPARVFQQHPLDPQQSAKGSSENSGMPHLSFARQSVCFFSNFKTRAASPTSTANSGYCEITPSSYSNSTGKKSPGITEAPISRIFNNFSAPIRCSKSVATQA